MNEDNPYRLRAMNCLVLGFQNYDDYLVSSLWKAIRRRVLQKSDRCLCGRRSTTVHHATYAIDVLRGDTLDGLISSCRKCHKAAERYAARSGQSAIDRLQIATLYLIDVKLRSQSKHVRRRWAPVSKITRADLKQARARARHSEAVRREQSPRSLTPRLVKRSSDGL